MVMPGFDFKFTNISATTEITEIWLFQFSIRAKGLNMLIENQFKCNQIFQNLKQKSKFIWICVC